MLAHTLHGRRHSSQCHSPLASSTPEFSWVSEFDGHADALIWLQAHDWTRSLESLAYVVISLKAQHPTGHALIIPLSLVFLVAKVLHSLVVDEGVCLPGSSLRVCLIHGLSELGAILHTEGLSGGFICHTLQQEPFSCQVIADLPLLPLGILDWSTCVKLKVKAVYAARVAPVRPAKRIPHL